MTQGVLSARVKGDPGLVIVGTGVAALRVAQTVRQEGYEGPVLLVGSEPHLPYDRPPLSKQVLGGQLGFESTQYHPASYFADLDIEIVTGVIAVRLDPTSQRVHLQDGTVLPYRVAVVATGARPRRLPFAAPPPRGCTSCAPSPTPPPYSPTSPRPGGSRLSAPGSSAARLPPPLKPSGWT